MIVFVASYAGGATGAETISSFPIGVGGFGGSPGFDGDLRYLAQSFVAGSAPVQRVTFAMSYTAAGGNTAPNLEYHLLLTETTGDAAGSGGFASTFKPTTILFDSGPLSLPLGSVDALTTVDLGGTTLTPGNFYALVFDPFTMLGGPAGSATGRFGSVGVAGSLFGEESLAVTRAEHLAGQWFNLGADLPFTLTFAIPGDLNFDGVVNLVDVQVVGLNWQGTGPDGDADHNKIVNLVDVQVVGLNWGQTGGQGTATAVPEPSTLLLACCGAAAVAMALVRGSRTARRP